MRKTKIFNTLVGTGSGNPLEFIIGDPDLENAGQTLLTAISGYNRFCIQTLTGSVRVKVSLDGINLVTQQLVLSQEPAVAADAVTEAEGTFVAVTSTTKLAWFFGDYRAIRAEQVGATGASIRLLCAAED